MKKTTIILLLLLAVGGFLTAGLSGCVGAKRAAVIRPAPDCTEALAGGFTDLSDNALSDLLDQAALDTRPEACWIPLMKKALDENRDISRTHLLRAVKVFNKKQHEDYFHKAVYRYLADIAKTSGRYRVEDRRLLENYCSYLIQSAATRADDHLGHAKLLCKRLDPELYAKFFE